MQQAPRFFEQECETTEHDTVDGARTTTIMIAQLRSRPHYRVWTFRKDRGCRAASPQNETITEKRLHVRNANWPVRHP